jgi:hypothetical protein
MPIAGILYVMALLVSHHNTTVAAVGAMSFALIAVCGWAFVGHQRQAH